MTLVELAQLALDEALKYCDTVGRQQRELDRTMQRAIKSKEEAREALNKAIEIHNRR